MVKFKGPPIRFWIGAMVFMTTFTNYLLRSNMSVSIISMVGGKNGTARTPICVLLRGNTSDGTSTTTMKPTTAESNSPKYDWDENEVGNIIAAYFWGYMVTSLLAGPLTEVIGAWHVIMWTSVASAVLTGLTPVSAQIGGATGVIVDRFFIGFFGGFAYPALNDLIAKWAPPKEKGKFIAAMMGNTLGTVVAFNLVAVVTNALGWEYGFYVLVICMVLYCVAFGLIVTDRPEQHKWCSEEEKTYIFESQGGHLSKKKQMPPYLKMLRNVPFWALVVAQFGNLWGLNLVLTYAPKFMAETLGFNIKASAGLAALPYLARLFASNVFGIIGDWMRKKEIMSVSKIRKFFIIFSHFIPAACMILMRAFGCMSEGVVTMLVLNQGFNGAVVVSHLVNAQDLAPNYAGAAYGVVNFIGMTTGMFVPKITGAFITYYDGGLAAATAIFMLGGVAFAACGVFFIIFGSGEVQPWNKKGDEPAAAAPTTEN